jgi:hypothetical protein
MGEHLLAKIGYVGPMVAYPVSAAADPETRANMRWDWREMPVRNGRSIPGGATLGKHGFTVAPHKSAITDFDEGRGWAARYAREIERLIKEISGAAEVILPQMRFLKDGVEAEMPAVRLGSTRLAGGAGTVDFCHNDFTAASVGRHVAEIDPERAEERLARRFAIYNTWRLVSPPPQSKPLAICDPTSVSIADLVPGDTYYYDEIYHQNALFRYSPNHRWYYYPDLRVDEVLIWAGYDSDPRFPSIVPHCAFENPDCTDPDACRIDVDCRVYAFFDD